MKAKQITTYAVNSKAIVEETELPVTLEADEASHLESGVINLHPGILFQEIEGFGGALTDTVGYLYAQMTEENKKQFLEEHFGENGQHYSFCVCIWTAVITLWKSIRRWKIQLQIRNLRHFRLNATESI